MTAHRHHHGTYTEVAREHVHGPLVSDDNWPVVRRGGAWLVALLWVPIALFYFTHI